MGLVIIAVIVLILVGMVILARRSAGRMAVPGSGTVISQIKPLEGFSRVNVGNAFQVELSEAPRHSVTLTADDNVIARLLIGSHACGTGDVIIVSRSDWLSSGLLRRCQSLF